MKPWARAAATLAIVALSVSHAAAHTGKEPFLKEEAFLKSVGFDQRLGAQVPLDTAFRDESGKTVTLGSYFNGKPVVMLITYYNCTMLCPLLLDGLVRALRPVTFNPGKDFTLLTVSINPRETPEIAASRKALYAQKYGRPGVSGGWHFLTGQQDAIQQLTTAVGFRYVYDAAKDEYAHATGIILLTPQGRVSRYFYGVDFSPRDIRLGLVEAAANTIGSPIDQVLLYCYHYDPLTGKYGLVIMNILRLAGLATVVAIGSFMLVNLRRERQTLPPPGEAR